MRVEAGDDFELLIAGQRCLVFHCIDELKAGVFLNLSKGDAGMERDNAHGIIGPCKVHHAQIGDDALDL